ncbi:MAG: 3-dehydroquinate synthase II, partial [Thermoproteota archaeon]|nr:3-dehydroquinate synthase II [Thermoproteota archaeon]
MTELKAKELIVKPTVPMTSLKDFLSKLREKGEFVVNIDPNISDGSVRTMDTSEDADIVICVTLERLKSLNAPGKKLAYFKKVMSNLDIEELERAAEIGAEIVIVDAPNWKIIPLENIIA